MRKNKQKQELGLQEVGMSLDDVVRRAAND